ncbi:MAG TPA: MOSC domain-containing protein, partial [Actinomycetota bacterium]|nr:MOSC domain-containing protein [Actinomycetota bacterium]
FRPNFLVEMDELAQQFVEQEWVGRRVEIGAELKVDIIKPCGRCVMVTHAQDELPQDKKVLQTVARKNENKLGVLARVVAGGRVRLGDRLVVT